MKLANLLFFTAPFRPCSSFKLAIWKSIHLTLTGHKDSHNGLNYIPRRLSRRFYNANAAHGGSQPLEAATQDVEVPSASLLPNLPIEVWRRIIGFTIRLAGANALDLEDIFAPPYQTEELPSPDPVMLEDRKNLPLVCSSWRAISLEITAEYLMILSEADLRTIVKRFEASKTANRDNGGLGGRTLRIEFVMQKPPRNLEMIIRLLRCTPNLIIYVNKNGSVCSPERQTPTEILQSLAAHCGKSLRRVEWAYAGEAPSWVDLADLCHRVPNLQTLRLLWIFSYATHRGTPPIILPRLKTLSLGPCPNVPELAHHLTWVPLLSRLAVSPQQLPSLERLEVDGDEFEIDLPQYINFFEVHGKKIRFLRTKLCRGVPPLSSILPLCPDLHSLVLSRGVEELQLPTFHLSIKRICVLPMVKDFVDVPNWLYMSAVLRPLEDLLVMMETMTLPNLVELRIRNVGAFTCLLDYPSWLRIWWMRWSIRGVRFEDKMGRSLNLKGVVRDEDHLLDLVREPRNS